VRNLLALVLFAAAISLAGCGGGGGNSAELNNTPAQSTTGNVQLLTIEAGPTANYVNALYTSVTICVPGSVNCQTIDHILVDTGSSGLRIMASVLSPALALPAQTNNALAPLVECLKFVDAFTWGPVKLADVKMASEQANSVPIQVIGDPGFTTIPADCSSSNSAANTVADFGANGILGISVFQQDCGIACELSTNPGLYYICPAGLCQSTLVRVQDQVQNPVSRFATNKNGVIISLPSIPSQGAPSVTGSLTFGIGTQANNHLGNVAIIPLDQSGNFTTTYGGITYNSSFIDSGSNGLFFPNQNIPSLTTCGNNPDFYCPLSVLNFSVINHGTNNVNSTVSFNIANANTLFNTNPTFKAFNSLGGPFPNRFDFGLPFFYGRSVYTAIEGMNTEAGNFGPYVAY
jgi:hypothetical protein